MSIVSDMDTMALVRARLFARDPFFASLASNLELVPDETIKTARVNNSTLWYNPKYVESLTKGQRETLLAHETLHPALGHIWRVGSRDLKRANQAADYAVNEILEKAGYESIPGWLRDPRFDGMVFEQIYSKLADEESAGGKSGQQGGQGQQAGKQGQNGPGQGNAGAAMPSKQGSKGCGSGQPGQGQGGQDTQDLPTGDFTGPEPGGGDKEGDQETPGAAGMSEGDWEVAREQAIMAGRAAGTLPGGFAVAVQKAKESKVDWIAEVREFITHSIPAEVSWATPNRRFVHQGLYLPGPKKENVGRGVLAADCSGSTMGYQKIFANEFMGLLKEARPEQLTVIYWDAKPVIPAEDVQVFGPDDFDMEYRPRGFGGTVFQPVVDYVANECEPPAFMVVLTDLYFTFPAKDPGYPVLWAVPDYCSQAVPPFGRVVYIPKED